MLFGPWQEAKPADRPWVVDLPEDDPSSFDAILAIVHAKFDEVPTRPPIAQLYHLLITTNKYDMLHVIKPWAHTWVKSCGLCRPAPEKSGCLDRLMRIYIGWELGCQEAVAIGIRDFVFNLAVCKDSTGAVIQYNHERISMPEHCGPPDFIGRYCAMDPAARHPDHLNIDSD